jgi:hypothetical protein
MGRLDTSMHPPPVRLSRALAIEAMDETKEGVLKVAKGAGNYGQKEARFASVPIMLRIHRNAGPNTQLARGATIPINTTRRKRGFAAVTTLPTDTTFPGAK